MIYFMRHGLDDERFIGGWSDVSLTKEGIDQVKKASIFIKNNLDIKSIYSSDIRRAYESAKILSCTINKPISLSSKLRELNKGIFNGKIKTGEFVVKDIYSKYPEGESFNEFFDRIKRDLDYILSLEDSIVVTHRGVINAIYYILNDKEIDLDKDQFDVTHASIHEYDNNLKKIKRIY